MSRGDVPALVLAATALAAQEDYDGPRLIFEQLGGES